MGIKWLKRAWGIDDDAEFVDDDAKEALVGEWFIEGGGYASYADGDIGDANHDVRVLETIAGSIEEENEIEPDVLQALKVGPTEEQAEYIEENYPGLMQLLQRRGNMRDYFRPEEKYERVMNKTLTPAERAAVELSFPGYLAERGMPKDYAVRHLGWIRVVDSMFTLWQVNEQSLKHIYDFAFEETGNMNVEIEIYELSTNTALPFTIGELYAAIQTGNAMAAYQMKKRRTQDSNMW